MLVWAEVAEVASQKQMVLELACRAHRDEHKACQLRVATSAAALGDVGRNRGRAASKLGNKSVHLFPKEHSGDLVDAQSETITLLPSLQLPEIPHIQVIGPSALPQ